METLHDFVLLASTQTEHTGWATLVGRWHCMGRARGAGVDGTGSRQVAFGR